jgi:hypothetical protein
LNLDWNRKILRGEYYDGKNLWVYFEPAIENGMNRKIDFRVSDIDWLRDRIKFVKSNFEDFLNVKQHDDL